MSTGPGRALLALRPLRPLRPLRGPAGRPGAGPALKSLASSELSFTLAALTAPSLSSRAPMLCAGKTRPRAALPTGVAPSTAIARAAMDRMSGRRLFIGVSSSAWGPVLPELGQRLRPGQLGRGDAAEAAGGRLRPAVLDNEPPDDVSLVHDENAAAGIGLILGPLLVAVGGQLERRDSRKARVGGEHDLVARGRALAGAGDGDVAREHFLALAGAEVVVNGELPVAERARGDEQRTGP